MTSFDAALSPLSRALGDIVDAFAFLQVDVNIGETTVRALVGDMTSLDAAFSPLNRVLGDIVDAFTYLKVYSMFTETIMLRLAK